MFSEMLENVRRKRPLVHSITNYVTANDCANILLACGASAIMADDADEAEEIAALASGVNLNLGTPNERRILAMLLAGKKANALGIPVLLDPVGVGASKLRTDAARKLKAEIKFTVIRGNLSEMRVLSRGGIQSGGVDSESGLAEGQISLGDRLARVKQAAAEAGTILAVSGEVDLVSDGHKSYLIRNGHPYMSKVTGTGCQLSALITAFVAANPDHALEACAAAVAAMGLCGQKGAARMSREDGNATYRNYIIDAVYNLDGAALDQGADYDVY